MGGSMTGHDSVKTVEAYDPVTNSWASLADMPTARNRLGVATGSNGKIYAIGGQDDRNDYTAVVEEYDPVSNTWATRRSMSTERCMPGVVAGSNSRIYAIGGDAVINGGLVTQNSVEEYNPITNSWMSRAAMPSGRESPGIAATNDGKIYIVGGSLGIGIGQASYLKSVLQGVLP